MVGVWAGRLLVLVVGFVYRACYEYPPAVSAYTAV
jgi:hypothetical protein